VFVVLRAIEPITGGVAMAQSTWMVMPLLDALILPLLPLLPLLHRPHKLQQQQPLRNLRLFGVSTRSAVQIHAAIRKPVLCVTIDQRLTAGAQQCRLFTTYSALLTQRGLVERCA